MTTANPMAIRTQKIARKGKRLLCANFHLAKKLNHWEISRKVARMSDAGYILVYQMGKVGSTSVYQALRSNLPSVPIFHVHTLSGEKLREREEIYRSSWRNVASRPKNPEEPKHLWHGQYLQGRLSEEMGRTWRIVTLVRDPVARVVSSFFQGLGSQFDADSRKLMSQVSHQDTAKGAQELFYRRFPPSSEEFTLTWFDDELKETFGVDIWATPFPRERHYQIYRSGRTEVLLLKLEGLNACAQDAFQEFLGLQGLQITRSNDTSRKYHKALYRSFLESFRLPEAYLNQVYGSEHVKHIYSSEEIDTFKRRWSA